MLVRPHWSNACQTGQSHEDGQPVRGGVRRGYQPRNPAFEFTWIKGTLGLVYARVTLYVCVNSYPCLVRFLSMTHNYTINDGGSGQKKTNALLLFIHKQRWRRCIKCILTPQMKVLIITNNAMQ